MKAFHYLAVVSLWLLGFSYGPSVQADIIETFGSGTNQFNMTFVPIGNPGNAADTTGDPNPAGSVGYAYNMGKYEVSRDMVNKANAEGGLGLQMLDMTLSGIVGGNGPNRPAAGVSWYEAARYVNWLNTSKGYTPAYKFSLQPGDGGYSASDGVLLWSPGDPGYNAANLLRNSLARYFLPSMDEWYKAAHYDPSANGGAGGYWNYPTGSDTVPTAVGGGTAPGTAVFAQPYTQGPADIDNAGGLSPYGVMALGGNGYEWEETEFDLLNDNPSSDRGARGGWDLNSFFLTYRINVSPSFDGNSLVGFRVASIPEPSSAALLSLASMVLWRRKTRSS